MLLLTIDYNLLALCGCTKLWFDESWVQVPINFDFTIAESAVIRYPELVNLYGCTIGEITSVGPFVEIQESVVIGQSCNIQSHSMICEGVTIEDNVFVGH